MDDDEESRENGFTKDLHPWMFGYDAIAHVR